MSDEKPFTPLPRAPSFTDEEVRHCKEAGDYRPILFEWYKFVGSLNAVVAHIQRESPAFRPIPDKQFNVLVGLLNRCARLMLSNVALSHEGKFGETTAIVDRCIFESAVKIIWLCFDASSEKFTRYLADGLKTELEFKAKIEANIGAREGEALQIEKRMLTSISNHMAAADLTEAQISEAKKLPDLASMLSIIGFDRLIYITAQKIGSHHVHGTWPSLLFHYLEEEPRGSGTFVPRDHNCSTHVNQFMFVPLIVLAALSAYINYVFESTDEAKAFCDLFESAEKEIMQVYSDAFDGGPKLVATRTF
ncbi:hypothetical protein ACVWW6_000898 [Bradyrhizobium sp. USDA 3311]